MSKEEIQLKKEQEKTKRARITHETAQILERVASKWAIILGSFLFFLLFLALLLMNI